MTWLKEAEEESSEEEDEVELSFDDRANISTIKEQKVDQQKTQLEKENKDNGEDKKAQDDDDDLDIDDI